MAADSHVSPEIGEWYLDRESTEQFKVIAVDGDGGLVEVQYLDGDVGALDTDEWQSRNLSLTEEPEDWTGALEAVQDGDAGFDEESFSPSTPLPEIEDGNVLLPDEGLVGKVRGTMHRTKSARHKP